MERQERMRHGPERTCLLTRTTLPQGELMRFTLDPQGRVVPDLRRRLPGRGAWLTPTAAALAEAIRRRLFSRSFKREALVPPDLVKQVDAALERDLLGALSLANKAGAVTAGFTKVEAALRAGRACALLHAREAAEDGRRKLAGLLRNADPAPIFPVPTYDDLRGDDLDMALGRVHVVHAALLAGAGSEGCLARWRRLRRFRGVDGADAIARDAVDRPSRNEAPTGQDRDLDE